MLFSRRVAAALAVVLTAGVVAFAEDWPKWRGPRADGISQEKGLADTWPAAGPAELWRIKVGKGYASPAVVNKVLYLFSTEDKKDTLAALDPATGNVLWKQSDESGWNGDRAGARATPCIEGDKIYTYGGAGDLTCRALADGKLLWRTNLVKETGGANPTWGTASNPLIVGNVIYMQAGDKGPAAVAVNKADGKILWKSQAQGASYAQPALIDAGGTQQLIVFGADSAFGLNPKTGATIWSIPWPTKYRINATNPIYHDGLLFLSSAYNQGTLMVKPTPTGVEKVWTSTDLQCHYQPPILENGYLYLNSVGTLKCIKWPDAKPVWEDATLKLGNGGSLVRIPGDKMIAYTETGKLYLLKVTPQGATRISEKQLFKDTETWATPLVYDGKLYVKGGKNQLELVCLDISAK